MRDTVIRKQEELVRLAEVAEADFLGPLGIDQGTDQAPHPFELSVRTNQGQDTREQASRDQGQRASGQGRAEDGNRSPSLGKHPSRQRKLGTGIGEEGSSNRRDTYDDSQC